MSNKKQKPMKQLALFFTTVFFIGTSVNAEIATTINNSLYASKHKGYGNSFIFMEGNIEFSVFPDGQFDFYVPNYGPKGSLSINTPHLSFSFNTGYDYGPYVQYDDYGAIIQIENVPIYYDYYGRISQAGNVKIHYNNFGRVSRIGGLYVYYDKHHRFTRYTGYINAYNRTYVYQPWHHYYTVPVYEYRVVYTKPYRKYYKPVRYTYYRPYVNNYRVPVRYESRPTPSVSNGRRTTVANNSVSDRYRQEAVPRRSVATSSRNNNVTPSRNATENRSSIGTQVNRRALGNTNREVSNRNSTENTTRNNAQKSNASMSRSETPSSPTRSSRTANATNTTSNQAVRSAQTTANVNKNTEQRKPNATPPRTYRSTSNESRSVSANRSANSSRSANASRNTNSANTRNATQNSSRSNDQGTPSRTASRQGRGN